MMHGNRLREARSRASLTQQLGKAIARDQQYISQLERNVFPGATIETLEGLCNALGVSSDDLLELAAADEAPAA